MEINEEDYIIVLDKIERFDKIMFSAQFTMRFLTAILFIFRFTFS